MTRYEDDRGSHDTRFANPSNDYQGFKLEMDPGTARALEQQRTIRQAEFERMNASFRERIATMGVALWCDPGDHPFKGGIPGSQSYVGTEVNDDGKEVQVQMNVCPEHTFRSLQKDETTPQISAPN